MARSVKALVKPELLVWAREDIGLSVDEMAKKLGVKPDRVIEWESGQDRPTVAQLRKYGEVCRRPIAVFYLPEPPKTFKALRDFRRLAGSKGLDYSRNLRLGLREVLARRAIALDLMENENVPPPPFELAANLSEPPSAAAERIRRALGISWSQQLLWRDPYVALKAWRQAVETLGVLVFQVPRVSLEEMRGFSISEFPLPVIGVNSKDHPHGRIFSLIHELVHIMLRQGGLCDFRASSSLSPEEQRVEVFCNAVAGETLVPTNLLLEHEIVRNHGQSKEWSRHELEQLGAAFSVSKEVIIRRLLILGRTTRRHYQHWRKTFAAEGTPHTEGGPPYYQQVLANLGNTFVRLVLENYYANHITLTDVSRILNMKLQHLPKVEQQIFGEVSEV